jgi:outer membrane protein assembly factor BamA
MYGGGITLAFSDMLGNHNLVTAFDASTYGTNFGDLHKNIGGLVAYTNTSRRLNWGLSGGQAPYVSGGFAQAVGVVDDQPALLEQEILQRQTWRGAEGVLAYPFNEARRVEFGGGYQQVSFEQEVRTIATSLLTGATLVDVTERDTFGGALHMGTASAALVYDTSVFGATSPIAGRRSRFEVSPTVGTLSFTGALADYRHYLTPARFYTIAVRGLHYGRYGRDSEDARLLPIFMGYPEFIRGYGIGSFRATECAPGPAGDCEAFDRLLGSRMMVGNVELRFPLLRPFGVREGMYGPVPVEVALFADGGVAWTKGDKPTLFGGNREPVSSAGVTFRASLFGFAVAQVDFAYPFQRPGRGWVWGFSLAPGF